MKLRKPARAGVVLDRLRTCESKRERKRALDLRLTVQLARAHALRVRSNCHVSEAWLL